MSFEDILDIPGLHAQYRRRRSRALARRIGMAILSLIAVAAIGFPIVAQYRTAQDLETVASHAATPVAGWSEERIDAAFAAARAYNRRLAGQASAEPDVSDLVGASETALPGDSSGVIPTDNSSTDNSSTASSSAAGSSAASPSSGASSAGTDKDYDSLLNTGNGVMGAISIPSISANLPIYHGTSAMALESGIGHLQGSSLPIGGASTHAVLTGHRGLVKAAMFTRLDEVKRGDTFSIMVLGRTMEYRVDRIAVIEPDDTSQLGITPGEDRVTLMTCTPYGVNTHRLLVSGTRVAVDAGKPAADVWQAVRWSAGGVLMAGLALLWIRRGSAPQPRLVRHRA